MITAFDVGCSLASVYKFIKQMGDTMEANYQLLMMAQKGRRLLLSEKCIDRLMSLPNLAPLSPI